MPHTAIAYWLAPAEPARGFLEKVIADLAGKHDAPVFEPHLTIYVGSNRSGAIEEILSQAAIDCEPIQLEVLEVRQNAFCPNRVERKIAAAHRNNSRSVTNSVRLSAPAALELALQEDADLSAARTGWINQAAVLDSGF